MQYALSLLYTRNDRKQLNSLSEVQTKNLCKFISSIFSRNLCKKKTNLSKNFFVKLKFDFKLIYSCTYRVFVYFF